MSQQFQFKNNSLALTKSKELLQIYTQYGLTHETEMQKSL